MQPGDVVWVVWQNAPWDMARIDKLDDRSATVELIESGRAWAVVSRNYIRALSLLERLAVEAGDHGKA